MLRPYKIPHKIFCKVLCVFLITVGIALVSIQQAASASQSASATPPQWRRCEQLHPGGEIPNSRLVLAENGWILRPHTDFRDNFRLHTKVRFFWRDFAKTLRHRGIQFSLVPIPPRGLLHDFAPFIPREQSHQALIAHWQHFIRQWGYLKINTIDLLPKLQSIGSTATFVRDHHWSPIGAQAAALHLAHWLAKDPVIRGLPKEKYLLSAEQIDFFGSYAKKYQQACRHAPPAEPMTSWTLTSQSDDLFGDTPEPVIAITGDSNLNEEFGFSAHLSHALSQPILNRGVSGGGFHQGILSTLTQPLDSPTPYHLMWLIPGYLREIYNVQDAHREILAAAQGRCHADNALKVFKASQQERNWVLDIPRPKENSGAWYLQIPIPHKASGALAWPSKTSLNVNIYSNSGDHWQHHFTRKRSGLNVFSLALPTKLAWQSLRIHLPLHGNIAPQAALCGSRYLNEWPPGIAFDLDNRFSTQ